MATPTPASSIKQLPSIAQKVPRQRDLLRDRLLDIEDAVAAEKTKASKARKQTEELQKRLKYLEENAEAMKRVVTDHNSFLSSKRAHEEKRHESLGSSGMLCFREKFGEGDHKKPPPKARNSRRTGFYTDYQGRAHLGDCEWLETWKRQQAANEEIDKRETQRSQRRDAALKVGTPEPTKAKPLVESQALPDLERMRHQSSRRTRFYTNYEGKRIMMDPCNWPSHHGFVMIGM